MNEKRRTRTTVRPGAAFTLVEILVVMVIIGLLLGLLLPVVSQLRNRAHKATTMNLINELVGAFGTYAQEDVRHLYPPPRSDNLIGWNTADPKSCGAALAPIFKASATEIDRDPTSPTYLCLIDGFGRGMRYLLDGPLVDATGTLQMGMMSLPATAPATVTDWNPNNTRPFAYVWSLGIPVQGLPADAASTNSGQWLYRRVAP